MAYTVVEVTRKTSGSWATLQVVRTLQIAPYASEPECIADLLGYVKLVGRRRLVRVLPARDPYYRWLRCTSAESAPIGNLLKGTNLAATGKLQLLARGTADIAVINATYTPPNVDTDDYDRSGGSGGNENTEKEIATETWEFSGRNRPLPNQFLKWEFTNQPLAANISETQAWEIEPHIDYRVTRHMCIRKPTQAILKLLGTINKRVFNIRGESYPIGTVRLDTVSASRRTSTQGFPFTEVTYGFSIFPLFDTIEPGNVVDFVTWNRRFDPIEAYWQRIVWSKRPTRRLHRFDDDMLSQTIGGRTISGFDLLYHPAAA